MSMLSQWIQSLTIYKTMLKYYQDKNVFGRILFFVFIVALFVFLVWGTRSLSFDRLNTGDITFAEEVIPVDGVYFYNQEKYDRELALTKMDPAQIVMIHKREPWYIPTIRRALDKASIPEDFVYLPIAESALRNVAVSTAGAAGIRQFMPDTARRYGLIVDQFVDQRLDFEKSTQAAVRYLQDLYKDLGSWTLVAAAYNRGENGLVRDLARQGVDSYFDAYLNSETSRYVFRIVALKYVLENKYSYFGADVLGVQYTLPDTKTIRVGQVDNIAVWAKERGYTYLQIRQLNPWIIGNQLPDGAWEIKVFD